MSITCLIIDDEQPARELLKKYLSKVPDLELIGACKSPLDALSIIQEQSVDLLLLDIQMPDLKGTELLRCITGKQPLVIFTTAYQEYAIEGFELDVVDYMLKPISFDRFLKGIQKVLEHKQWMEYKHQNLPSKSISTEKDYIALKSNQKLHKVQLNDILYIEGMKEYVVFYTEVQKLVIHASLKSLETRLPQDAFLRVHKSYIVNKNKVSNMFGNQLAVGDKYIPIGYSYKRTIVNQIF
ncbi:MULTISPECIES: LytTR family DNA-binding domain-containing protein [unclassified Aureispira]|uniref:LytR/AlgR family response regulator transcription factor n=1 Tax=unclassified Aureispira TaxID=2649989 RepID=UPI0006989F0A|nr:MULTISPECIES: LytTR family DNA-binding domain-containing protein [unclassified Aureispira]WMX15027.1 LytTR family DNA-binding domain-containing protein [Aureispira sp. CCB-E]